MLRTFAAALCALAVFSGSLLAEEIKGKVKSVDADKSIMTVTVGDKDQEYKICDDTKIVGPNGQALKDGLKAKLFSRAGVPVVITTEKKDGKDVVKEVKIGLNIKPIQPGGIQIKPLPAPIKPMPVPIPPAIKPMPVPLPALPPVPPQPLPIQIKPIRIQPLPIQIQPVPPAPPAPPVPVEDPKKDK